MSFDRIEFCPFIIDSYGVPPIKERNTYGYPLTQEPRIINWQSSLFISNLQAVIFKIIYLMCLKFAYLNPGLNLENVGVYGKMYRN